MTETPLRQARQWVIGVSRQLRDLTMRISELWASDAFIAATSDLTKAIDLLQTEVDREITKDRRVTQSLACQEEALRILSSQVQGITPTARYVIADIIALLETSRQYLTGELDKPQT